MLTWTRQKPNEPGWYWMIDPIKEPNLPTIVQITFDRKLRRWSALVPASQYPKTPGKELELEAVDAMWAGPIALPAVAEPAKTHPSTPCLNVASGFEKR